MPTHSLDGDDLPKGPGAAVHYLRVKQGLTLEQVAEVAGGDTGNLSKFERGMQRMDERRLARVARLLQTDVAGLLRLTADLHQARYTVKRSKKEALAEIARVEQVMAAATNMDRARGRASLKPDAAPDVHPEATGLQPPKPAFYDPANLCQLVTIVPVLRSDQIAQLATGELDRAQLQPSDIVYCSGLDVAEHAVFGMRVVDDSMTAAPGAEESYPVGVTAIFELTSEWETHDCVLVHLGGDRLVFTSLVMLGDVWYMTPLNPRYPPQPMPAHAKVFAVAVGCARVTRRRRKSAA